MPKITEERRQERRGEILAAAIRCFGRKGYQRTSMTDLIAESGLSAGAIYGYFDGKQEIIYAVAQSVMEGPREDLAMVSRDHPLAPSEIATMLIRGLLTTVPVPMVLQVWSEATVDPELRALADDVAGRMRRVIEEQLANWASIHVADADSDDWARVHAPQLVSLVAGFLVQRTLIDGFDEDAYLASLPGLLVA